MGVGHSDAHDLGTAGAEAVATAVAGRNAALVLVFCPVQKDYSGLLDAVRAGAGSAVIAGCTSFGQVVAADPGSAGQGVLVLALGGTGLAVTSRVARDASADRRLAGVEAGGCLDDVDLPNRVCVLLADGLIGEQHELVRGAYSVLGAGVPLVGGCAADNLAYGATAQFHGDEHGVEVLRDSVVGIGLGSVGPLGTGIAHGWRKVGDPMVVTSSSGGRLRELDESPALGAYLDRLGKSRDEVTRLEDLRAFAFSNPLGLSRRTGEDIRVIHGADFETGELQCLADVPQGALAWLMETDPESLILGAKESVAQAVAGLDGAAPIGVLTFDCGARRVMLGEQGLAAEVGAMAAVLGDVPFGGFYTYGEIARTQGARGMHHLTVVSLALG
jgi:hypothetical protein